MNRNRWRHLRLEALEARSLLATLVPLTGAIGGTASLDYSVFNGEYSWSDTQNFTDNVELSVPFLGGIANGTGIQVSSHSNATDSMWTFGTSAQVSGTITAQGTSIDAHLS